MRARDTDLTTTRTHSGSFLVAMPMVTTAFAAALSIVEKQAFPRRIHFLPAGKPGTHDESERSKRKLHQGHSCLYTTHVQLDNLKALFPKIDALLGCLRPPNSLSSLSTPTRPSLTTP